MKYSVTVMSTFSTERVISAACLVSIALMVMPAIVYAHPHETSDPFCPQLTTYLKVGSRDSATNGQVSQLQHFFSHAYGMNQNEIVTGYFGALTRGIVAFFQSEHGIDMTGTVGPVTRAAIARECVTTSLGLPQSPQTESSAATSSPARAAATFTQVNHGSRVLVNGVNTLYAFSMQASSATTTFASVDIVVNQLGGVEMRNLRMFGFTDAQFTRPISEHVDGRLYQTVDPIKNGTTTINLPAGYSIPAGDTRYFLILADASYVNGLADAVTTQIFGATELGIPASGAPLRWLTHDGQSSSSIYNFGASAAAAGISSELIQLFRRLGELLP